MSKQLQQIIEKAHMFNYLTIVDEMTSMLATNLLQINLLQKSNL